MLPRLLGLPPGLGGRPVVGVGAGHDSIYRLFDELVPAEVIAAYDWLLAHDGCAKDQADALVGDAGLVEALTGWGMAHVQPHTPADPAWLRPALARGQELMLDGQRRLADAQARFGMGMNGRFAAHLVSVGGLACSALRCACGYDQTVTGGAVIGRILRRSGVSAGELAMRLGIAEGQVAAWMRGDPPLSVVDSVAHACSMDLAAVLAEPEPDPHDLSLLETTLAMTVDQRLERLKGYVRFVLAGRAALGIER